MDKLTDIQIEKLKAAADGEKSWSRSAQEIFLLCDEILELREKVAKLQERSTKM